MLVPFGGGEHDWAAIELGAWLSRALAVPLRLAGPRETGRDASRLLASASLATQRAFGVTAEPLLVEPGPEGIVDAAEDAALVVVGLSDRWQREGLGHVRSAIVEHARPPVLLARSGLRPGGLAPRESPDPVHLVDQALINAPTTVRGPSGTRAACGCHAGRSGVK